KLNRLHRFEHSDDFRPGFRLLHRFGQHIQSVNEEFRQFLAFLRAKGLCLFQNLRNGHMSSLRLHIYTSIIRELSNWLSYNKAKFRSTRLRSWALSTQKMKICGTQ